MKRNNSVAEQKEQTVERKNNLVQCMALWTHKNAKVPYVTGLVGARGEEQFKVVGFFNGKKKNPKEPDLRIYEDLEKGRSREELVSLWLAQAKSGTQYYYGYDNEKKRVVAFHNANKKSEKSPDITVYYPVEESA